jgi:hypothetical protein
MLPLLLSKCCSGFSDVVTVSPPPPEAVANPTLLSVPQPYTDPNGRYEPVSGQLVDCGFALNGAGPCGNATGKICLIERGFSSYCVKANACVDGGGVGVLIFNRADRPLCEPLRLSILVRDLLLCLLLHASNSLTQLAAQS